MLGPAQPTYRYQPAPSSYKCRTVSELLLCVWLPIQLSIIIQFHQLIACTVSTDHGTQNLPASNRRLLEVHYSQHSANQSLSHSTKEYLRVQNFQACASRRDHFPPVLHLLRRRRRILRGQSCSNRPRMPLQQPEILRPVFQPLELRRLSVSAASHPSRTSGWKQGELEKPQ